MKDIIQGIVYDTDSDTPIAHWNTQDKTEGKYGVIFLYKTKNNRHYKYVVPLNLIIPITYLQAHQLLKEKGFIDELIEHFHKSVPSKNTKTSIHVTKIIVNEKNGPNNYQGQDIMFIYTDLPCLGFLGNRITAMITLVPDMEVRDYIKKHFPDVKDIQYMMHDKE